MTVVNALNLHFLPNQLIFSNTANSLSGIPTINNGVLITSAAGVPSISTVIPLATQANITQVGVLTAGTWNANIVPPAFGGTGANNGVNVLSLAGNLSTAGIFPANFNFTAATDVIFPIAGTLATIPGFAPGGNLIVNGDFQVWQRGAGGAAVIAVGAALNAYTADRWQLATNANQASTATQAPGPTSGSFLAKIQRNAGQTGVVGNIVFASSLTRDMCVGAAGNPLTISFKASAGADFSGLASQILVRVITGTQANDISVLSGFTAQTNVINQLVTITPALASYSLSCPAIPANITALAVTFGWLPVGVAAADDSFSITDVQLEISTFATPFQRFSFFDTWTKCQRFYQKTFNYGTAPVQNVGINTGEIQGPIHSPGATNNYMGFNMFPQMRINPAIVTFSPGAASAEVFNVTGAVAHTLTSVSNVTPHSIRINSQGNAAGTVVQVQGLHLTLSADVT
jgi:hypothetical protein